MSYRGEPKTVMGVISKTVDTVRQQSRGNTGVKQQNIRVGDQLIEEGPTENTLVVTDLNTGANFTLPQTSEEVQVEEYNEVFWNYTLSKADVNEVSTIWSGTLKGAPWFAPFDLQIIEIIISQNYYRASTPVIFSFFPNTISIDGELSTTLPDSDLIWTQTLNAILGWQNNLTPNDPNPRILLQGQYIFPQIDVINTDGGPYFSWGIQMKYIRLLDATQQEL